MSIKHDRAENEIKESAAMFIAREQGGMSLITVTRVMLSDDEKTCKVFVSILPKNKEAEALAFLKRKRGEMRDYIKEHIRMRATPFLDILLDRGEENRQRIDEIAREG